MQVQVRSMRATGWVVIVLLLIALALLPFAIALAFLVGALALGFSVARAILLPPSRSGEGSPGAFRRAPSKERLSDPSAIDAEYEVKEPHEKDQA